MPRRTALAALAVLFAITALAACGGPSKSSLLSKGDEVCRTANGPAEAVEKPTNYPELMEAARALATATGDQDARLRKLGIPDGDKDEVRPILSAVGGLARSARRLEEASARTDDRAASDAAGEVAAQSEEAATRARAYGFTACGINTEGPVGMVFEGAKGIVKAAFVARAQGLCREAINEAGDLREPRNQAAFPAYLDALLALEEKVVDEMRALAVPPGDQAAVAELIDARAKLNTKGRELTSAMRARNGPQQRAVADELAVLATAAAAKADAYGLRECGTGSILG